MKKLFECELRAMIYVVAETTEEAMLVATTAYEKGDVRPEATAFPATSPCPPEWSDCYPFGTWASCDDGAAPRTVREILEDDHG